MSSKTEVPDKSQPAKVFWKHIGEPVGRGVFAALELTPGEEVDVCPIILLRASEARIPAEISQYVFDFDSLPKLETTGETTTSVRRGDSWLYRFARQFARYTGILKIRRRFRRHFVKHNVFIALGNGSLYNHSDDANLEYWLSSDKQSIVLLARRVIFPGEELTINYNSSDGVSPGGRKDWFEAHGIVKLKAR